MIRLYVSFCKGHGGALSGAGRTVRVERAARVALCSLWRRAPLRLRSRARLRGPAHARTALRTQGPPSRLIFFSRVDAFIFF